MRKKGGELGWEILGPPRNRGGKEKGESFSPGFSQKPLAEPVGKAFSGKKLSPGGARAGETGPVSPGRRKPGKNREIKIAAGILSCPPHIPLLLHAL